MSGPESSNASAAGAIICADLYPTDQTRTSVNDTFAVRDLVEGAQHLGASIDGVVRFRPLLSPHGIALPRLRYAGGLPVFDAPRIGTLSMFSRTLTRAPISRALSLGPKRRLFVCHLSKSFLMAKRVFTGEHHRFVLVAHASDLSFAMSAQCFGEADAIYARSHAVARQLEARGQRCDGVLSSGIPAQDIGSPERGIQPGRVRIVLATRMIPLRNVIPCLEAIRRLAPNVDAHVDIFGDGPLLGAIADFVASSGLEHRVVLHGFRPREEVLSAMQCAHLFLMPSAPETFGLAYLEAMAKGCVVVGHHGWGIDGVIKDGWDGYLVSAPEPDEILGKILGYMSTDRPGMHQRAHATAMRNTAREAALRYAEMIALQHEMMR